MHARLAIQHRFERGFSWSLAGDGLLSCRSHALVDDDDGIWLIDPIDCVGLDEALAEIGNVAGVIVLLDRHLRDAPELARRHGVGLHVPPGRWRRGHPRPRSATALVAEITNCPFRFFPVVERQGAWLEYALWWREPGILVVAEALGTTAVCRARRADAFGVHPLLRLGRPPATLVALRHNPRLLLVGHGDPVLPSPAPTGGARARHLGRDIRRVVRHARRDVPHLVMQVPHLATDLVRARRDGRRLSC
ncbi:MAG: hypothetical protein JWN41_1442 [Thermoleophilia bacterium]|nr:hypothetical protein [Thermoleophilia bacterium]